jgi:hypothetical protein
MRTATAGMELLRRGGHTDSSRKHVLSNNEGIKKWHLTKIKYNSNPLHSNLQLKDSIPNFFVATKMATVLRNSL